MRRSSATEGRDDESEGATFVSFELGGQGYAMEVAAVREILDPPKIRPLPCADYSVLGVIDVRGETVPVIDLASRLGAPTPEIGDDARIMVVEDTFSDAAGRPLAVIADRVLDVLEIPAAATEPAPPEAGSQGLVRRVARLNGGALVFLLDAAVAVFGVDATAAAA